MKARRIVKRKRISLLSIIVLTLFLVGCGKTASQNGAGQEAASQNGTEQEVGSQNSSGQEMLETEENQKTQTGQEGETDMSYQTITAAQAKEIMDSESGYVILDVREADEFAEGHIEGAIQLSYLEVNQKAEALLTDKSQQILVYCRSGRRSAIAAQALANLGYTNIKDFGGIIDWPYEVVK